MTYFCNNDACFNVAGQELPGICGVCGEPLVTTSPSGEALISLVEGNYYITMPLHQFETMNEQRVLQLREKLRGDLRGNVLDEALMQSMRDAGIKFDVQLSTDGVEWFDVREL